MKKFQGKGNLSRDRLANPYLDQNINNRYSEAKIVDMRNNFVQEKNKDGYVYIRPIDNNKTY
ncbi:hypothetical protein ASG89_25215 [Paenibacillus sp. Soil766]|uniref:hypothetical protein n=1 Tax=Paenibacillus sp. Soil766 TaxID=1736404 RepID=UPI00070EF11A|nr:hypothetical protein [Paenibacillus sp. Soil766]KRF01667.1 hypothetical protein ASG89_25215 [Paenibacillus sp. Soil766]